MNNIFTRARDRETMFEDADKKRNAQFLINAYPSIVIKSAADETQTVQAAVVSKQEKDYGYIFTAADTLLTIGSVWIAKDLRMIVDEKITVIKDTGWNKYHYYLCNVQVDGSWGYLKSSLVPINVDLEQNVQWQSQAKYLLMIASNAVKFGTTFKIADRG